MKLFLVFTVHKDTNPTYIFKKEVSLGISPLKLLKSIFLLETR